jgi:hypothetical protein
MEISTGALRNMLSNSLSSKRKALTTTLLLALLFSTLAGAMLVSTGLANPFPNDPSGRYHRVSELEKVPPPNPATIDIQNPQSNASYKGNHVILQVSIAELSDDYEIYCYLNGRQIAFPQRRSFTMHLPELPEGSYTIKVSVSNKNIQKQTIVYYDYFSSPDYYTPVYIDKDVWVCSEMVWSDSEVNFRIDNTAPRVSILSPQEQTYGSEVLFDFIVDEVTRHAVYSLDGQANVTTSGNTMLKGLSNGEHTVTVYAWDEVGNVGSTETITFTVAKPESFPITFVVVAIVVSALAVATGLLFYFKKRKR